MSRTLPRRTKLLYGSGELFNGTSTVIVLMLYLKFLTDVVGLSPLLAGFCVVIGKLWDAISDPLIGMISDRTLSRFGRRRVYFLLFSIPASLSFVSMWFVFKDAPTWAQITYYSTSYIVFKTLSTLLNVPYQALGPELTDDYNERTSLVAFRMAFSIGGAILAGVIPGAVIAHFARIGEPAAGHIVVSSVFGGLYIFIWLWIFARLAERPQLHRQQRQAFIPALKLTLKNRSFRILIGVYLGAFLALDTLTAAAKFYVDEYLLRPSLMPALMGTMLTLGLFSVPLYNWLTKVRDRKSAFVLGATVWCLGCLGILLLPTDAHTAWVLMVIALIGVGLGAAFVVPWSALPEVIDVDRAINGRSSEGMFTGVMTFLRKASTTLAIFGLSAVLEATGYTSDTTGPQPGTVTTAIRWSIAAIPALMVTTAALWMIRYPISKSDYELLRTKLSGKIRLCPAEERALNSFLKRAY